jgi:ApaG protein
MELGPRADSDLAPSAREPTVAPADILELVSTHAEFVEVPGLLATIDRVVYQPDAVTLEERPHCFAYFITIRNDGDIAVTLKGRKWVVQNSRGEVSAVEGDGIVGQCPTIGPGEKFSYNSYHLVDTPTAEAEGSYLGVDANGRRILVRIPRFKMAVPEKS